MINSHNVSLLTLSTIAIFSIPFAFAQTSESLAINNELQVNESRITNSFGESMDSININNMLQITSDISNTGQHPKEFVYHIQITENGEKVESPKWMSGMINSNQTMSVGLSWIPTTYGNFIATISFGTNIESLQIANNMKLDIMADTKIQCKNGKELVYRVSDNSSLCVSHSTAIKLVERGLVTR